MPKVSVILPVYNVEKYINKCIQSLLAQTLKDCEFIFVDDCSPDNSIDIVKKYNDPRIKILYHEVNKYTAEARNTGVKEATGEYIAFVDPDDYIEPNFLEKLYKLAKQNKADIAKGVFRHIPKNILVDNSKKIKMNKYRFNCELWSAIYKRELFNKPFVKFYVDVMVCNFLLVYYANKVVTCTDAIYNYVTHEGSCVHCEFTPEKWRRLNVRGAQLVLDFMNKLKLSEYDYCLVLCKTILNLYQYGYRKMSKENRIKYKAELNSYFDDVFKKAKYKNRKFLTEYKNIRSKYA